MPESLRRAVSRCSAGATGRPRTPAPQNGPHDDQPSPPAGSPRSTPRCSPPPPSALSPPWRGGSSRWGADLLPDDRAHFVFARGFGSRCAGPAGPSSARAGSAAPQMTCGATRRCAPRRNVRGSLTVESDGLAGSTRCLIGSARFSCSVTCRGRQSAWDGSGWRTTRRIGRSCAPATGFTSAGHDLRQLPRAARRAVPRGLFRSAGCPARKLVRWVMGTWRRPSARTAIGARVTSGVPRRRPAVAGVAGGTGCRTGREGAVAG